MSEIDILWTEGRGVARRIGQIAKRLSAVFAPQSQEAQPPLSYEAFMATEELAEPETCVELPAHLAFGDRFDGRSTAYEDLQNILANQAAQITPLKSEGQTLLADIDHCNRSNINLLIVHN